MATNTIAKNSWRRSTVIGGLLIVVALAVAACGVSSTASGNTAAAPTTASTPSPTPVPTPTAVPTPVPPAITGTLTPGGANSPIADRHIVLCLRNDSSDLTCTLTTLTTASDAAGHFAFATVPAGNYLVFYDSGWDPFEAGLATWTGQAIHVGDLQWLASNYFDSSNGNVSFFLPAGAILDPKLAMYRFFGQSPFFWAHTCAGANCDSTAAVEPVEYDVTDGSHQDATFVVYFHTGS